MMSKEESQKRTESIQKSSKEEWAKEEVVVAVEERVVFARSESRHVTSRSITSHDQLAQYLWPSWQYNTEAQESSHHELTSSVASKVFACTGSFDSVFNGSSIFPGEALIALQIKAIYEMSWIPILHEFNEYF